MSAGIASTGGAAGQQCATANHGTVSLRYSARRELPRPDCREFLKSNFASDIDLDQRSDMAICFGSRAGDVPASAHAYGPARRRCRRSSHAAFRNTSDRGRLSRRNRRQSRAGSGAGRPIQVPSHRDLSRDREQPIDQQRLAHAEQAHRQPCQQAADRQAATHRQHIQTDGLSPQSRQRCPLQQRIRRGVADCHRRPRERQVPAGKPQTHGLSAASTNVSA